MNQHTIDEISKQLEEIHKDIHCIEGMLKGTSKQIAPNEIKTSSSNYLTVSIIKARRTFRAKQFMQDMFNKTKCLTVVFKVTNNGFINGYTLDNSIMIKGRDGVSWSFPEESVGENVKQETIKYHGTKQFIRSFMVSENCKEFDLIIQDSYGVKASDYFCTSKRRIKNEST